MIVRMSLSKQWMVDVVGVMEQRGFTFYEDDIVTTITAWLIYESHGRNTQYSGYVLYTFRDGATQFVSFEGDGDAIGKQKGKFTFIKGTDRFEGIKAAAHSLQKDFPLKLTYTLTSKHSTQSRKSEPPNLSAHLTDVSLRFTSAGDFINAMLILCTTIRWLRL